MSLSKTIEEGNLAQFPRRKGEAVTVFPLCEMAGLAPINRWLARLLAQNSKRGPGTHGCAGPLHACARLGGLVFDSTGNDRRGFREVLPYVLDRTVAVHQEDLSRW